MVIDVPKYIVERLCRSVPEGCFVNGMPHLSYGDPEAAIAATISLNPNGGPNPSNVPDLPEDQVGAEWERQKRFFADRPNWRSDFPHLFGKLEKVLCQCGLSFDGVGGNSLAVALDLVQWPTSEPWRKLSHSCRSTLLKEDQEFFGKFLTEHDNLKVLLVNGGSAIDALAYYHGAQVLHEERVRRAKLVYGEVYGKMLIGWRPWITYLSGEAWERVGELYREKRPQV